VTPCIRPVALLPIVGLTCPRQTGPRWTCPERWTALEANFLSYWTCPERWTALEANFLSYKAIAGLGTAMDFMNSVGVLLPIELCGRRVLYSCLNASHFT
jgi:hypothetical protein